MSVGSARLAAYAETRNEDDLLAAYEIAKSPVQMLSLSKTYTPALESFLERLHSALCLGAENATQSALEYAADICRLTLIIRPAGNDTRTGFLEARALSLEKLSRGFKSEPSPFGPDLLIDGITLRRRLLQLANTDDDKHEQHRCLAFLLRMQWTHTGESDLDVLREEIDFRRKICQGTLQDRRASDSEPAIAYSLLATSLYTFYQSTGDLTLLDEAVELQRKALCLRSEGHPKRALSCADLATSLWNRFQQTGDRILLDEALDLRREVLHLRPEGHLHRAESCRSLATALWTRFKQTGDAVLLDKALGLQREILLLTPEGHPHRASSCVSLASSLRARFNQTGDLTVLDEAIELQRKTLHLTPEGHPQRASSCGNLASSLRTRFNQTGDPTLLDEALELQREALHLRPEGHADRASSCTSLATSLWTRFNQTGDMALLDEALGLEREALNLRPEGHPHRAVSCGSLATSLWTHFNQTGNMALLDEALELQRESLRLQPEGHLNRASSCGNLANMLRTRFNRTGDTMLLDEALELERKALRLRPEGNPYRDVSCGSLANLLWTCFNHTGDTVLLDEAIELERETLRLRPDGHPHRTVSCGSLAESLNTRFDQTGDTALLYEALELHREALRLTPEGHPDRPLSCGNLAASLNARFKQTGDVLQLEEALELEREALRLTPEGHTQRAISCGNLASSLRDCFKKTGNLALLNEALELEREALRLRPEGHLDHAASCISMATSLWASFNQTGDPVLLNEARVLCMHAIKQSSISPSDHVCLRVELARIHALPICVAYSPSAAVTFLLEAIQHRVSLIPEFYSIDYALRLCAEVSVTDADNARLLEVYRAIVEVLPELGSIILDKGSRLRRWRRAGSLPLEALLCALKVNDLPLGLELLEQGRAVLWSQTLAMQDPQLQDLPDPWKLQIRRLLRSVRSSAKHSSSRKSDLTARDWAHASYTRLQRLLHEIRASPGLERFMLGPSYSELVQVASPHPVIILAADDTACYAVIISSTVVSPTHLVLDGITASELEKLGHVIRGLDSNVRARSGLAMATEGRGINIHGRREDPTVRKLNQALRRLWFGVVKPIFDCLSLQVCGPCVTCSLC
jgi:hypothetical protein